MKLQNWLLLVVSFFKKKSHFTLLLRFGGFEASYDHQINCDEFLWKAQENSFHPVLREKNDFRSLFKKKSFFEASKLAPSIIFQKKSHFILFLRFVGIEASYDHEINFDEFLWT